MDEYLRHYLANGCYFSNLGTSIAKGKIPKRDLKEEAQTIIHLLQNTEFDELIYNITTSHDMVINSRNIPQISNFEFGTLGVLQLLKRYGDYGMTYVDIGKAHKGEGFAETAYIKYGENHVKLALNLDLLFTVSQGQKYTYISELGYQLLDLPTDIQNEIIAKQILNIPVIRYIIKRAATGNVDVCKVLAQFVSGATAVRRAHSVKKLITYVNMYYDDPKEIFRRIE